jgi:hypothetical protein
VLCGLVIFALVVTGAGPLVRQVRGLIGGMRGAPSKPGQPVAMTLIVCGTACILGAIAVEFYLVRHGQTVLAAWGAGHAMTGSERVVIGVEPPVFGHLMTVLTFVAGGTLAGIGVWASTGKVTAYPSVPPVPSAA